MKTYMVNEMFHSLQGEGVRAGTAAVFVRFTGCNLACSFCDTEYLSGSPMTAEEIAGTAYVKFCGWGGTPWVIFTGGEPGLQLDAELVAAVRARGFFCAIETNGTVDLAPLKLDWITVSPKAGGDLKQKTAHEVKYVLRDEQRPPDPCPVLSHLGHYLLSPMYEGDRLPARNLAWCVELIRQSPQWRLSLQQHKQWGLR